MQPVPHNTCKIWQRLLPLAGALLLALSHHAAHGQELLLLGGLQSTESLGERSYGYAYSYQHNLGENWYATFTYLNEGHVTNHHRDGHSVQLWWRYLAMD